MEPPPKRPREEQRRVHPTPIAFVEYFDSNNWAQIWPGLPPSMQLLAPSGSPSKPEPGSPREAHGAEPGEDPIEMID